MSDKIQDDTADGGNDNANVGNEAAQAPVDKADPAPADKAKTGGDAAKKSDSSDAGDTKPLEDWRVKLANGDEKELKRLSRFASEADVWKAYRELEKKRDSGEYKKAYPKDGSPEEIAQWRKDNNVPDSADKYDLSFDDGLVISDDDKPIIDLFVSDMHGVNATNDQVKAAIKSYYELQRQQVQRMEEADSAFEEEGEEVLRTEWGGEYKKNIKAMRGLLDQLPDDVRDSFATARTADGKLIGNHPEVIKWLTRMAYEINPVASVMPAVGDNASKSINDEIGDIEKMIRDPKSDYWRGAKSADLQERYRKLLDAKAKIG